MNLRLSTRAAVVGSAFYVMATGVLLLLLKTSVVLPAVAWLRGVTLADLDTYLSILARGCIALGAVTLLAVILLARVQRPGEQRASDAERE